MTAPSDPAGELPSVGRIDPLAAGAAVAVTAWALAEFFTRKRRMALPSILLLLAFRGAIHVRSAPPA